MKTMRVLFLVPFLVLTACSRHAAQQTAQTGAQPETTQAAQPTPDQAAPPPASVLAPPSPGEQPSGGPAPTVAEQAHPPTPPAAPPPPVEPSNQAAQSQPATPPIYGRPAPSLIGIPPGTVWRVRLEETLDTRRNRPGDRFDASLIAPIRVNGAVVVPRGTHCSGVLVQSKPSGRFKGRAILSLSLNSFDLRGRRYYLPASRVSRESGRHRRRNLVLIGGGAGVGATIGAVAGGPVGALIGAGAGGAAGTAGAAITGKKNLRLPVETTLAFYQRAPLSVKN